jgi:putative spermidine/putrescine transport system ATP-binding protein
MLSHAKRNHEQETRGACLQLENLTKIFGDVVAVNEVNLKVEAGEFLTLLGPSGSGKTTTLLLIAGFQLPTAGEIYIDGKPIILKPPHKRNLGMVFQNYALFPHMTVFDNIAFPLRMRGVAKSEIAERTKHSLDMVRMPGYEKRYPRQLSGGQQQRVALARAVIFNPQVLLMDEPLGALDKKLREEMQLEVKHIQEELGITVIYVTHDQEEALTMSDRIAVLNVGQIQQVGSPDELYEKPANLFVADFIGESNILTGKVTEVSDDVCVVATRDGLLLKSPRVDKVIVGHEASCVIRPEKPVFLEEGGELPNVLQGTVAEVIYLGESTKYRIRTKGGDIFDLRRSSVSGEIRRERGDEVKIGWALQDSITLKA